MTQAVLPNRAMHDDISSVAHSAYAEIAGATRSAEDIRRIAQCSYASQLMVPRLVNLGYAAKPVAHENETRGQHVYIEATHPQIGIGVVADPTWQQFLPNHVDASHMPAVLVGSREAVKAQAQGFGVPEDALSLWDEGTKTMDPQQQREEDQRAQVAADTADQEGKWEAFMGHR
jgi:hypothetical protein